MAALSADVFNLDTPSRGDTRTYVIENAESCYVNGFVGLNSAGYLDPWADTAGLRFLGLFQGYVPGVDSDGTVTTVASTSESPATRGRVDVSGRYLRGVDVAGVSTIASLNAPVYCTTDNYADLSLTATTNVGPIGWLCDFRSASDMDVALFTPWEYLRGIISVPSALTENSTTIGGTQDNNFASLSVAWNGSTDPTAAEGTLLIDAIRECANKINELRTALLG